MEKEALKTEEGRIKDGGTKTSGKGGRKNESKKKDLEPRKQEATRTC